MSLQSTSSKIVSSIEDSDNESVPTHSKVELQPLPRPERKRHRSREDRGLPADEELQRLAQIYLETQCGLWPNLVEKGVVSDPSPDTLTDMVEDFKSRHRNGKVNPDTLKPLVRLVPKLGGGYFRFSCDNSNPLSIADQMVNCLRKAREQETFIPWKYLYADFSVTGLTASRQGYSSYKQLLSDDSQLLKITFIDDFSRASRDDIEWWRLAYLSRRCKIGLVGASDGFDLSQPDWDMKVTLYALFSRLFIKQLQEKVRRGMSGSARRGTSVGKLSLGFTRKPKTTTDGNPVLGSDGTPINVPCHDPKTVDFRRKMYDLFVNRNLSAHKIAKWMNEQNVDGWNSWTRQAVQKLLGSPTAVGIFIWNQYRNEYDHEQEKTVRVKNPRKEWEIHIDKSLAVVDLSLWKQARRKLADIRKKSPLTGTKKSRNQKYATTLFSGTLVCGYCGREIILQRSTGKYKQLGCLDGWTGVHNCQLSSSKSTKIVEESLLKYLFDVLLTPETVKRLLDKTNRAIGRELKKPQVDTRPLESRRVSLQKEILKWTKLIEESDDLNECKIQNQRLNQAQAKLKNLEIEIREAKAVILKPIPCLQPDELKELLGKLREVLNSDIPVAAEAIRSLTGPITIHQEPYPDGKRGSSWIATFTPQLLNLLEALVGREEIASLRAAGLTVEIDSATVSLVKVPKYVSLAPEFLRLKQKGVSVEVIAATHKISYNYAAEILDFAETGKRPVWKGHSHGGGRDPRKYIEISSQVVKMKEEEGMSFAAIAKKLSVGRATVTRAYDHLRPEAIQQAVATGKSPRRGRPPQPKSGSQVQADSSQKSAQSASNGKGKVVRTKSGRKKSTVSPAKVSTAGGKRSRRNPRDEQIIRNS